MLDCSRYLLNCRASLSWMDVKFPNQNPCIPSWPGVFQFGTFLSVALNESKCISIPRPFTSPCTLFFMLFIHSAFMLSTFCSDILLQNCFVSFASGCSFVFVHSLPTCSQIFLSSWNILFCLYCLTLYRYFWSALLLKISCKVFLRVVLSDLSAIVFLVLCILDFLEEYHLITD